MCHVHAVVTNPLSKDLLQDIGDKSAIKMNKNVRLVFWLFHCVTLNSFAFGIRSFSPLNINFDADAKICLSLPKDNGADTIGHGNLWIQGRGLLNCCLF